jgi:hypothetical protein
VNARAPLTPDEVAIARRLASQEIENANARGYRSGAEETLTTLERANCFTTARSKRFVERLRRQLGGERPSPDDVREAS